MENVVVHPPLCPLIEHKAFLSQWVAEYRRDAGQAVTFMAEEHMSMDMRSC